jgi:hypothetical protein
VAELKTKKTAASVSAFVNQISDEQRRKDVKTIMAMMREATGEKPAMWGSSIVGFGRLHYTYASGREGEWFRAGFAPRKDAITLYLMDGLTAQKDLLEKLGTFKKGGGCLYVKKLADVDQRVLKQLIVRASRAKTLPRG